MNSIHTLKKSLKQIATKPKESLKTIAKQADLENSFTLSPSSKTHSGSTSQLLHIAYFQDKGNAGDTLLPITIQDFFRNEEKLTFENRHAHKRVKNLELKKQLKNKSGIIIGGGGLFLRDTNPNQISGWQWACPTETIREIEIPICLFAVGYNRFRGQDDFGPYFTENVNALAEKSVYFGLRNNGSVQSVKSYLKEELKSKVRYQPCLTTVLAQLYPEHFKEKPENKRPRIGINIAFDRPDLRYKGNEIKILTQFAKAAKALSEKNDIHIILHDETDQQCLAFMRNENVPYTLVNMHRQTPGQIINTYKSIDMMFAMRGHGQMIPFGCQIPTISLISHDKLAWFLQDIGHTEWGIDIHSESDITSAMIDRAEHLLKKSETIVAQIRTSQESLWATSLQNRRDFLNAIK